MSRCPPDRTSGSFTSHPGTFSLEVLSLSVFRESKLPHHLSPGIPAPPYTYSFLPALVDIPEHCRRTKMTKQHQNSMVFYTAFAAFPANQSNSAGYSSPCSPCQGAYSICRMLTRSLRSLSKLPRPLWCFFSAVLVLLEEAVARSRSKELFSFPGLEFGHAASLPWKLSSGPCLTLLCCVCVCLVGFLSEY